MPLGSIPLSQSGWFLVRAIADVEETFRFASTAPFYVEVDPQKQRISRRSATFFLDWIAQRIDRIPAKLNNPQQLQEVLTHHRRAKQFWQHLHDQANAD